LGASKPSKKVRQQKRKLYSRFKRTRSRYQSNSLKRRFSSHRQRR